MGKKLISMMLLLIFCIALPGCSEKKEPEPEATLAPGITRPEGGIESTDPPIVTGQVTEVKDDKIILNVQNVEWELLLNDHTQWEKQRFAELEMPIIKGSFLRVYYEEADGKRTATKLEHLKVN
ncbi:MAG: hypothetical protein E7403_02960 [Ruminococcaceae bacterium]|nr:hypothetical protein [Oscillospiraceae bacterium]